MMIEINIIILDKVLALVLVHFFHFQILIGVKMLLFFEYTTVHQWILIIRKKIYKGSNNILFVNGTKMYQFEAKDSEIKPFCFGNISKIFCSQKYEKKQN